MSELEMELEKCRSITGQLLESTNSVLSGPRIVQKRGEFSSTVSEPATSPASDFSTRSVTSSTSASTPAATTSSSSIFASSSSSSGSVSGTFSDLQGLERRDVAGGDDVLRVDRNQNQIPYVTSEGSGEITVKTGTGVLDFFDNLGEGNAEACIENVLSNINLDDINAYSTSSQSTIKGMIDNEVGKIKLTQSLEWYAQNEEEMKKRPEDPATIDFQEYTKTMQNNLKLLFENSEKNDEKEREKEKLGFNMRSIYNFKSVRCAIDSLLLEFLTKANIGDDKIIAIVQRGLYNALLVDLRSESMIFEYLSKLLSADDYLRYFYATFLLEYVLDFCYSNERNFLYFLEDEKNI